MMEIQIATSEDCRAIAELHVQVWQYAYRDILPEQYLASLSVTEREAMWRRVVEGQTAQLLVARIAGGVVGFVAFGTSRDEDASTDRAEIWAIYVNVTFWSMGVGRHLWLQAQQRILAEEYKSVSLWVLAENERALRFYERAGFVVEPQSRKSFELGGTTVEELRYSRGVG
ncbi:GNAT family N-acetyltransferase [Aidingimonas halophila]|nr:GNAT family N-acetyltransferase [Aidingimonas halophila]GHC21274.1 N-acetyltransferase [Aidingimonas halophila]